MVSGLIVRAYFLLLLLIAIFAVQAPLSAQSTEGARIPPLDIDLLNRGRAVFPLVWNAYRPAPLPPVDPNNGPNISSRINEGKLALSLNEFFQLPVEHNLTFQA